MDYTMKDTVLTLRVKRDREREWRNVESRNCETKTRDVCLIGRNEVCHFWETTLEGSLRVCRWRVGEVEKMLKCLCWAVLVGRAEKSWSYNASLTTVGQKVSRNSVCLQKIPEDRCVRIRERNDVSESDVIYIFHVLSSYEYRRSIWGRITRKKRNGKWLKWFLRVIVEHVWIKKGSFTMLKNWCLNNFREVWCVEVWVWLKIGVEKI